MKSIVIKYGLIGGILVSVFMSINMFNMDFESADMDMAEVIGYAGIFIALTSIFFGIKKVRDDQYNGSISFGKAFKVGFLIALIASTLYVVTWMVLSEVYFQDFGELYYNAEVDKIKNSGLSDTQIEEQIKGMQSFMEMYKNPIIKFFMTYIEILPPGILLSLIFAAVLKKK